MKNKKAKTEPKTLTQLALVLGVSTQLICAHRRKPGAPKIGDIPGWLEFLAAHGRVGSAPPEYRAAIAAERLAILRETKTRLKRENAVAAGELMPVSEARSANAAAWSFVFDQLERLCQEKPPTLAGRDAVEIFEQLVSFREQMRREAKQKFEDAA